MPEHRKPATRRRTSKPASLLTPCDAGVMTDHLPDIYTRFRRDYPTVAAAQDSLAEAVSDIGGLDERTLRLATLGIAIGALAEGSVRSNARRALAPPARAPTTSDRSPCARSPLAASPRRLLHSAGSMRSLETLRPNRSEFAWRGAVTTRSRMLRCWPASCRAARGRQSDRSRAGRPGATPVSPRRCDARGRSARSLLRLQ